MSFIKLYKQNSTNSITCYNIQTNDKFNSDDLDRLKTLIDPNITDITNRDKYVEIGPHLHIITPWSSNCQSILQKMGIESVIRIEKTYLISKNTFDPENIDPLQEIIYDTPLTQFQSNNNKQNNFYQVSDIEMENKKMNLGFDTFDIHYYNSLFKTLQRDPTNIELHDLSQSNSEHARHWFFKGILIDNDIKIDKSLFQMVKDTQKYTNNKSIVAFHDNSSVFKGYEISLLYLDYKTHMYQIKNKEYHFTFTAETHNFPTSICPFQGASTGSGGRIRDNQCVGRSGLPISGIAGYCVGETKPNKSNYHKKNLKTLIEASDGASDYGNKFGEPVIIGFTRVFELDINCQKIGWIKPIMYSGGVGQINDEHVHKVPPKKDMLVVKIGGPAFKIGFGGGAASSRDQNTQNHLDDMNAVQRGDPEMENRLNRLIRTCIELGQNNPIQNINDQGAGGTANVTKEIIYPNGADIYLDNIIKNDNSMSSLELWISEYQENNTILINQEDYDLLKTIAARENVPLSVIGKINDSQQIRVYDDNNVIVMDMPLEPIVGNSMPAKIYKLDRVVNNLPPFYLTPKNSEIVTLLKQVLSLPTVGSKRFLTNKVDRSVTGLIAQQQCVGKLHTPLSNYSITAQSHYNLTGYVTSIGEQPIKSLVNPEKMARMALTEMITNMIFAKITELSDVRFSANWMYPLNFEGEKYNLYSACKSMCQMAKGLGIAADRGKDSLSMSYKDHKENKTIKCPPSLVITGYAPTNDIRLKVTPYFKKYNSLIYYISFNNRFRLGCSQLAYICDQIGNDNDCPDLDDIQQLKYTFMIIQQLITENKILSGHDVSDGGLISTLCEMGFSGDMGFHIDLPNINKIDFLFNEEPGLIIEIDEQNKNEIESLFSTYLYYLGITINENKIIIDNVLSEKMTDLRQYWEKPSYEFEKLQRDPICVETEYNFYKERHQNIPYNAYAYQNNNYKIVFPIETRKHKIAIIRDEGTNGDRELASSFYMAGFDIYDLCINDFLNDPNLTLESFRGVSFPGGFSYSDVFGAGKGWATIIKTNERINNIFNDFKNRSDTFSLGICNGCQLMCSLGWIPNCKLIDNKSNKFESRCPFVKINSTNSIMLTNMENQMLPIWVAHGEGQFVINSNTYKLVKPVKLVKPIKQVLPVLPVQYIDNLGNATEQYPFNPNGSNNGVAAVCSSDGRHLAMMPHPERCVLNWQIPYETNNKELYSPWMQMFVNAYEWCNN